ncbi:glycosyltransferase family 2 protein [Flavobacterium terrigena]|uniref:Glycosyltransferase, GT2 family n=1 Tax=Flavobacterium terrigena TaxID=402734 RepID=A0A1H6R8Z4_9FLAO|nr:glycosyltransferase family A protein [Flavobacterium terrigena]SEI48105.1 Glycosyltransferase, GT2 family [Flavobacterium terrigena]
MIQVFHNSNTVLKISKDNQPLEVFDNLNISETIYKLTELFPSELILWCHTELGPFINYEQINSICNSNNEIISYNISNENYLSKNIGFVEQSIFINFSKKVKIATWQMSSAIGIAHATIFSDLKTIIQPVKDFDYFLNSIAKIAMPLGVFCYSNPNLLIESNTEISFNHKISFSSLFKFVSQHYKKVWLLVLFICLIYKKGKFPLLAFLKSFFYSKIAVDKIKISKFNLLSTNDFKYSNNIDVLIPTIGRKEPLFNFLKNLSEQTILPKSVIIIEQNPIENAVSELDYLVNENWPFQVKHQLIYQLGACNARNLALKEITSDWVFFADDDIEIKSDFLEKCLENAKNYNQQVFSLSCLLRNEKKHFNNCFQWVSFGSGASFVNANAIKNLKFDSKYEFGFGEDADFGMQIRNNGNDIIYFPTPEIIHLKAPMGGFRTKVNRKWDNDLIEPKPSPTVMVFKLTYDSEEQLFAYKFMYFFKNYNFKNLKNPIKNHKAMISKWNRSMYWAQKLISN